MSLFGDYARYYDLIYRDKDYEGETEFIDGLVRQHVQEPSRLLELGCGTGSHAIPLAGRGYRVVGLDVSRDMLQVARERAARQPAQVGERLQFLHCDVRNFELEGTFDAVVALFHVMSYQTGNDDLLAVLRQVKKHLAPGGVFIFDCWYGPAVLTDRPEIREKRFGDRDCRVTRVAVPTLHPDLNCVDVDYTLTVEGAGGQVREKLSESHRVRYLFEPELELLAGAAGLRVAAAGAWMSDRKPDFSSWYAHFVLRHGDY